MANRGDNVPELSMSIEETIMDIDRIADSDGDDARKSPVLLVHEARHQQEGRGGDHDGGGEEERERDRGGGTVVYDLVKGDAEYDDGSDNDADSDEEIESESVETPFERPPCCLASPRACCGALTFTHFFQTLLHSTGGERHIYQRIYDMWFLLGIVSAFFAAIAMVGLVEIPNGITTSKANDTSWFATSLTGQDWLMYNGYAYFVALVVNLLCVVVSAMLIAILSFVPNGSVRYTINKILMAMVIPAHIMFLGFQCLSLAYVFLVRITYGDTLIVFKMAAAGFAFGMLFLVIGYVYIVFARPSDASVKRGERHWCVDRCLTYTIGIISLSRVYKRMYKSGIGPQQIHFRINQLWTTASIVGAVVGGTAFEALWQRPSRFNNNLDNPIPEPFKFYAIPLYLSVIFCMYSVLLATLFLVINLFYFGRDGSLRMLKRYHFVTSVPTNFVILGLVTFLFSIPRLVNVINSNATFEWKLGIGVSSCAGVLITLIYAFVFALHRNKNEKTTEPPQKPRRFPFSFITFSKIIYSMLDTDISEYKVYQRLSTIQATVAVVASLVMLLSFLAVQQYSEYVTEDKSLPLFSGVSCLSLLFSTMATTLAFIYLVLMSYARKHCLKNWLKHKTGIIMMPMVFLSLSIFTFLGALIPFTNLVYTPTVILTTSAIIGACLVMIGLVRVYMSFAMTTKHSKDHSLEIPPDGFFSCLTRASQFNGLVKLCSSENELFDNFQFLFNAISIVTALLAGISFDNFREPPPSALATDVLSSQNVSITRTIDSVQVEVYSILSMASLGLNVTSLFTSILFATSLAIVPKDSMKTVLTRMRHVLIIPAASMILGVFASIAGWWWMSELEYAFDTTVEWALRGIAIFCYLSLLWAFIFVLRASRAIKLHRRGRLSLGDLGVDLNWEEKIPTCCEQGCWSYCGALFTGWPKFILYSGMSPRRISLRVNNLWNATSLLGALLTTITFISFQKGLQMGDAGVEPAPHWKRFYTVGVFASLCASASATFLCAFFMIQMSFEPQDLSGLFIKKMNSVVTLPVVLMYMGFAVFMVAVPTMMQALYGDQAYFVARIVCWSIDGLSFVVVISFQLFRGPISNWLYKTSRMSAGKLSRSFSLASTQSTNDTAQHRQPRGSRGSSTLETISELGPPASPLEMELDRVPEIEDHEDHEAHEQRSSPQPRPLSLRLSREFTEVPETL
eukprot:m.171488 g.171488  ORF g.171488 m.171488 type:complete len:1193 (-) comp14551_c0_seq7:375-3953(-)